MQFDLSTDILKQPAKLTALPLQLKTCSGLKCSRPTVRREKKKKKRETKGIQRDYENIHNYIHYLPHTVSRKD